jgi:hypothetical protein
MAVLNQIAELQVFTEGATTSFVVGAGMMLLGSVIVWLFLNVKHEELATDGPPEGAGVHI